MNTPEHTPNPTPRPEAYGISLERDINAQVALALVAYRAGHQDAAIDLDDLDGTEESVKEAAMMEWSDDSENQDTHARRFRVYAQMHPGARLDTHDVHALKSLLRDLDSGSYTVH